MVNLTTLAGFLWHFLIVAIAVDRQSLARLECDVCRHTAEILGDEEKNWPDRFAEIPRFLGIFGRLVRERREADNRRTDYRVAVDARRKADHSEDRVEAGERIQRDYGIYENTGADLDSEDVHEFHAESEAKLDRETVRPQLASTECPTCGTKMTMEQWLGESDDGRLIIECYCQKCDHVGSFDFDLTDYQRQHGNILLPETNEPTDS